MYEPVAQQVLPRLNVNGLLEVAFVGKKEEWEKIIGSRNSEQRRQVQTRYAHVTSVRADILYMWIHRLRRINPFFLVNTPPMRIREQTAELNKQLEALPDELLEKARIICDEAAIQSERALRSGVAASVEDTSIGSVFVAPCVSGSNVLPSNQFLRTVENSITGMITMTIALILTRYFCLASTPQQQQQQQQQQPQQQQRLAPLEIRNQRRLLNEFTQSDIIFLCGFPDLFLLGCSLPNGSGPLPRDFMSYLLRQSDDRFARSYELLFAMFNQMQRHAASRAVANRIQTKTATKSTQEFINLVSDRNFLKNLKQAIQDSSSPEAKNLERQLRCQHFQGAMEPW
jgi:hypothetical protein